MSHPNEHVIIYEPDHGAKSRELLLWQFANSPRIQAFVQALGAGAQLFENTAWAVIAGGSLLDAAKGATLDRWGEIVGEFRGGLNHEQFLRFIGLRIRVNTEHAGEQAMYEVLVEAVDPSTVSRYLVADGIVYQVASSAFLPESVRAHAGALIRDFRPVAIYTAVTEAEEGCFDFGSVATPGSVWGSIATPGAVFARLIYAGR